MNWLQGLLRLGSKAFTGPVGFLLPEIINVASTTIRRGRADRVEERSTTLKGKRTIVVALALLILAGGEAAGVWTVPPDWYDWLIGAFAVTVPAKLV